MNRTLSPVTVHLHYESIQKVTFVYQMLFLANQPGIIRTEVFHQVLDCQLIDVHRSHELFSSYVRRKGDFVDQIITHLGSAAPHFSAVNIHYSLYRRIHVDIPGCMTYLVDLD